MNLLSFLGATALVITYHGSNEEKSYTIYVWKVSVDDVHLLCPGV